MKLIWPIKKITREVALLHPVIVDTNKPAAQFQGRHFNVQSWNNRVIKPASWSEDELISSPTRIIQEFENENYLEALALVVSWGKMWRTSKSIWGDRPLMEIKEALDFCANNIQTTKSINTSWGKLTGKGKSQLGWSAVTSSKTLHFLCRSLGFAENPPVALDNAIIKNKVWPIFVANLARKDRPKSWRGNTLEAYQRYMTAILTWSEQRRWTTTEMEATIFAKFRNT
jgi:hypothetical protein